MYYLLPFRFERLGNKEILVNEVGDYLAVSCGSVERIIAKEVVETEDLYKDLVANFFKCL